MKLPLFPRSTTRCLCCLVVFATGALAEAQGVAPAVETRSRPPKLLERIGNFFYKISNGIERSDIPDSPTFQPGTDRRLSAKPDKRARRGVTEDAARDGYIVPVNPDPYLLRPSASASPKSRNGASPDNDRPTVPPESFKEIPHPQKSTAPLPNSPVAAGRKEKPVEPSEPAVIDSSNKGNPVSTANESKTKTGADTLPTATPTNRRGRVKSPYPPFTELDVTGMTSGSLAKDPVSGKIFRMP